MVVVEEEEQEQEQEQVDRGFGSAEELVLKQELRRRRQEEEEVLRRCPMFVGVAGVGFPVAATLSEEQRRAVDCGELGVGFYESEAGGSPEPEPEPHPSDRPRGGSGSKRTRAAEVHNLSEKRRRSRINEKMKALQILIPNSNKTDKASMLAEAIEYLKQLQLQVQMLSMRNGVYLSPTYLPGGALEPARASQMFAALAVAGRNITAPNPRGVVTPVNQSSGAHHSFDPTNSPRQNLPPPIVLSSGPSVTITETTFHLEPSQTQLGSFQLHESSEMIFQGETLQKHHLTSAQERSTMAGNKMNFIREEAPMLSTDHFDGCSSRQSHDMVVPTNTRHV